MVNLYKSDAFFKGIVQSWEKLLTRGVTMKGTRGIPPRIAQEGFESNKSQIETRGASKEAVMERDTNCTNLIESSRYDTTPVHYTIML